MASGSGAPLPPIRGGQLNDIPTRAAKRCVRATLVSLCLVVALTGTWMPAAHSSSTVEVVAGGFKDPVGVAVDRDGSIVVSDRKRGTVTQIATNGRRTVLLGGIDGPAGIAFDPGGGLLIVEERGRRVLRRNPSGSLEVLATGIVDPRWITTAPDGTIYLSAARLAGSRKRSARDHSRGRRMQILQLRPSGELLSIAGGFNRLEGLAWTDGGLYAAVQNTSTDRGKNRTWLVRVPISPGGVAGAPESARRGRGYAPTGIAADQGDVPLTVEN
jgi:DNA-binding beta-propeller fold protein YncE